LKELGYIDEEQYLDAISDPISLLMKQALEGIVVIPWTLILDKWRSQVFSGYVKADQLNNLWWELRESYQGVKAPIARDYDAFDPGAKYHIPGNTPYTRYYLARIMQYQFHESLCNDIGFDGPLHECTIYNNPEAGEKLKSMLALGSSVPWQDAFEELTGVRELSGESIINYYSPLKEWLDEKNEGRQCGW
jgi:peptidyl-dipeptidase A